MKHIRMLRGSLVRTLRPIPPFVNGLATGLLSALLLTLSLSHNVAAAPGDLDPSFGSGGIVRTDFDGASFALALALQPDGKLVAAGFSFVSGANFALARYNPDGSLDPTFGTGGKVITVIGNGSDEARALALQPDGKIVVAGGSDANFALARYNPDGSLDAGFGSGGKVTTDFDGTTTADRASALALLPNGKIVVAGGSGGNFALARYNPNGSLDATFGTGGTVITDFGLSGESAAALVLQPDGKIVVAGGSGGNFALARYNPNGSLDATFGTGGKLTTDFGGGDAASALALQPDGKIVVAGASSFRFALARYNPNGSLDATFGTGGTVITEFGLSGWSADAIALQPDGKIVVAGGPGAGFVLVRYTSDGGLDLPFGTEGMVAPAFGFQLTHAAALTLQPDGKIVIAGSSADNFALARYEGGSVPGAPFLRLDVNQTSFVPGETLRVGILEANFGPPVMVDKYFGALLPPGAGPGLGCPGGDAIVFLTPRLVRTCRSASPQGFEPTARNLLLPAGLPATSTPTFFSAVWPSDAPVGTYVFFIAFARAGTADLLALATESASLSAEPPRAPAGLTASATCRTITLRWQGKSGDETGFRIERRSEGGSFVEIATVRSGVTSYRDDGLMPGVVYTYRVRAYRGALNSAYSNEAVVTGGADPPQAPTNLTAAAVSSGTRLNWQDNSSNESGFKIELKVSAWFLYTSNWTEIATVGPGVTSYEDRLKPTLVKLTYAYVVRAFNGTCFSGYSNVSSVTR